GFQKGTLRKTLGIFFADAEAPRRNFAGQIVHRQSSCPWRQARQRNCRSGDGARAHRSRSPVITERQLDRAGVVADTKRAADRAKRQQAVSQLLAAKGDASIEDLRLGNVGEEETEIPG